MRAYLVLLQAGFTMPRTVTSRAVRSYRTLSALPVPLPKKKAIGGLLSAALSVGFHPPGVTWRFSLWSPDFPPHRHRRTRKRITQPSTGRLPSQPRARDYSSRPRQSRTSPKRPAGQNDHPHYNALKTQDPLQRKRHRTIVEGVVGRSSTARQCS